MPIALIWISSLLMSLSPQAIHRNAGLDAQPQRCDDCVAFVNFIRIFTK